MKEETTKNIANIMMIISIFSFIVSCGSCMACNQALKMNYGTEEYYRRNDGSIGYGAKSSVSGGDTEGLVSLISGVIFIISAFATIIYKTK